jgi:hypothetical protein
VGGNTPWPKPLELNPIHRTIKIIKTTTLLNKKQLKIK